jgi:HSP20 family protein
MAGVKVQKVDSTQDRNLPVLKHLDDLFGRIQRRAFELFAARGSADGHTLEDWFAAERELCWPAMELAERDKNFEVTVALPGFEASQVTVTATPGELIVQASTKSERRDDSDRKQDAAKILWSEFRSSDVYRRIEMQEPIDVSEVSAHLSNGLLKIVALKANGAIVRVPIAAAA